MGHSSGQAKIDALNSWKRAAEQYNTSVRKIFDIPGFQTQFMKNGGYITRDEVRLQFGLVAEDTVWNMYCMHGTQFRLTQDLFCLRNLRIKCLCSVDSDTYEYNPNIAPGDSSVQNGKICIFDWTDDDVCLGYALYQQFHCDIPDIADFSCDISLDDAVNNEYLHTVFVAALHFVKSLEESGYLRSFTLIPKDPSTSSLWNTTTNRSDHSISLYLLDAAYKKDKLLTSRIRSLFSYLPSYEDDELPKNSNPLAIPYKSDAYCDFDFSEKFYFLQDVNDNVFVSRQVGLLGGHHELKIYGRLDCPSALRYIAKGQYVKHRVFFADEATAIAAGYRPCGICSKEAYKVWKAGQKK